MATATQDFGIYIRENKDGQQRHLLLIQKGMSVSKVRKAASKLLKTKPVKKLFLSSGQEVKFVDELKQDAEVYISFGEKFYKAKEVEDIPEIALKIVKKSASLNFQREVKNHKSIACLILLECS